MCMSEEKAKEKKKQCYHYYIYRWKKNNFSSEVENRIGIV